MQSPIIRGATEPDLTAVLELWRAAGAPPTVSDSQVGLTRLLESDSGALLIATDQARLIGSLIATFDGWRASFYRLAVHPEHRRQGVASALLGEGERRVTGLGAMRLTAIVIEDDPRAMGFWLAAGYTTQSHRVRFVKPSGEEVA